MHPSWRPCSRARSGLPRPGGDAAFFSVGEDIEQAAPLPTQGCTLLAGDGGVQNAAPPPTRGCALHAERPPARLRGSPAYAGVGLTSFVTR